MLVTSANTDLISFAQRAYGKMYVLSIEVVLTLCLMRIRMSAIAIWMQMFLLLFASVPPRIPTGIIFVI